MYFLHHIGVMGVFGALMIFLVGLIGGAGAGYTAETESDLILTDDIDIDGAAVESEQVPTTPLTAWQIELFDSNDRVERAVTEHLVRPAVYGTMNYVAEPVARFTYHNQWIPLAFWKSIGYLGALVPVGYIAFRFNEVVPNV